MRQLGNMVAVRSRLQSWQDHCYSPGGAVHLVGIACQGKTNAGSKYRKQRAGRRGQQGG
jgi:hypothetical protein